MTCEVMPMTQDLFLGFGNNVDYEVKLDVQILKDMAEYYRITDEDIKDVDIRDIRSLLISIFAHMQTGRGDERIVASNEILDEFTKYFNYSASMGGTPIRAALALSKLGIDSFLHYTSYNDLIKRYTPPRCRVVTSSESEQIFPHLIIQFNKGDTIESENLHISAPKANRIIYHRDIDVQELMINPAFFDEASRARAIGMSGFNAIQDEDVLRDRLLLVSDRLKKLPDSCLVYYEDGGFYNNAFRNVVSEVIGPQIDIHGMNEDELQTVIGKKIRLYDVDEVIEALECAKRSSRSKCLLVHTSEWALIYGDGCTRYGKFIKNGINLATTRLIYGDCFTIDDYYSVKDLNLKKESVEFKSVIERLSSTEVFCEPSYSVANKNLTTIGLGDSFVGGFLSAIVK